MRATEALVTLNRWLSSREAASQRRTLTPWCLVIAELLFFASVGDVYRCKKIVSAWGLNLSDPRTADYDKRTPL